MNAITLSGALALALEPMGVALRSVAILLDDLCPPDGLGAWTASRPLMTEEVSQYLRRLLRRSGESRQRLEAPVGMWERVIPAILKKTEKA